MKILAMVAVLAGVAWAEEPLDKEPAPRPGQKWSDQAPLNHDAPAKLHLNGKEREVFTLKPGAEMKVSVPGEDRLLVRVRRDFAEKTDAAADYAVTWKLADGPEQAFRGTSQPSKSGLYLGKPDAVPGTEDIFEIANPGEGAAVVTFRLPADAKAAVTLRFQVEFPAQLPGSSGSPDAHKDTWWMGTVTRIRFGYDDNVWRFSHKDLKRYKDHHDDDPYDRFDKMASIDDMYFDSFFDLHIISPEGPLGRLWIGGSVDDRFYLQNHEKNVDEYEAYIRHFPIPKLDYRIFATFSPDHFWRNYDPQDDPSPSRAHAHYDDYTAGVSIHSPIVRHLSLAFTYTWELRDWNSKFNEKDSKRNIFKLEANWRVTPWLELTGGYELTLARSLATGLEHDASFVQHEGWLAADFRVKFVLFGASYKVAYRDHTTDHDATEDPSNSGRHDWNHEFRLYVGVKPGQPSELVFEYIRRVRRSSVGSGVTTRDDDSFSYDSNAVQLTFQFLWP